MNDATLDKGKDFYFHRAVGNNFVPSTRHYHTTFEIYYMKEGNCSYFIDKRIYEVKKGDLILIPEGKIHRTNYTNLHRERVLINCTSDFIPLSAQKTLSEISPLYRNPDLIPDFDKIFDRIEEEYEHNDEFSRDALRCYVGELIFLILRNTTYEKNEKHRNTLIEKAVEHIQKHYMTEIKLAEVAKLLSVSPEHLSRAFKKETGFGFNEYLVLLRLQRAEYMLRHEPGRSISEVAYACGFNDSNYFSDKFKRAYGDAPSHIRKAFRLNTEQNAETK